MITPSALNAEDVRQAALTVLQRHLPLEINGYKCDSEMVWNIVFKAASEHKSIEAACSELADVADSNTIREHINRAFTIESLRQQEEGINQALTEWLPAGIFNRILDLAIDTHDEPFYGKTPDLAAFSCRGQAKAGTTHFIRIASAYLIWRGVRLTLAVTYVEPDEALVTVLERLLKRIQAIGIRWSVLYMDKGFCSTTIIRYLEAANQPAIIACPIRGKRGGIRALCRGHKSYTTDYTFNDGTQATVALYAGLIPDKTGKRRRKWLAYVLIDVGWLPVEVFAVYRRRFGIECSYRSARRAKAVTTSRNPALRFFFMGLGLLLQNLWIRLRNVVARRPGAGRPRIAASHFPFRQFLHFLAHAIEQVCGVILVCPVLCASQSSIGWT
jgi:hypothetical protein